VYIFILVSPDPIENLILIAETVETYYYAMQVDEPMGTRLLNGLDPRRDHGYIDEARVNELRPYLRVLSSTMINDLRSDLEADRQPSFQRIISLINRY
jgi:hypothetical protein